MYHGKCISEFSGKWQRGGGGGSLFYMLDTSFQSGQNTIKGPTGVMCTDSVLRQWQPQTTSSWMLFNRTTMMQTLSDLLRNLSSVVIVRKRCREEATHVPSIYNEVLGGLRNTDCDKIVVVRNYVAQRVFSDGTFYSCSTFLGGKPSQTLEPLRQQRVKNNKCSWDMAP